MCQTQIDFGGGKTKELKYITEAEAPTNKRQFGKLIRYKNECTTTKMLQAQNLN